MHLHLGPRSGQQWEKSGW